MRYDESRPLKISDLEKITGIGRSTIHYYLRGGLLSPPRRTVMTMAYYHTGHLEELRRIREMQAEGYPLAIIKEMKDGSRGWMEAAAEETVPSADRKTQMMEKKPVSSIPCRRGLGRTNELKGVPVKCSVVIGKLE